MKLSVSLEKRYKDFDLAVDFATEGNRLGVFGRSGSGKSTLVHMLAGLTPPDRGVIELDGEILYSSEKRISAPPEQRRISVVFQNGHLFPHLSVRRNLLYGYRRTPASRRKVDPEALIEALDLGDLLERSAETLSGGERQRVALGRAVLASPRLLLMDEPLSALDEGLKYQIIPYLRAVFEQFDIPFLLISHSMNEMQLLADEVIVLHRGKVSDHSTPDELARKRMGWTRAGYINLLRLSDPRLEDGLYVYPWGGGRLLMWAGGKGESVFELSSKDIMLFKGRPEALSARNLLPCTVTSCFDLKNRTGVELDCGGERLVAQVMKKAADELNLRVGEKIYAIIKASAFRRLY
ncbi:molybdenum ABC transporter ATP-binding protein [Desulfuromonas sp. TF]|uniref:molybdenum ABC transporter ATP-binding protein n=1 Tax=Desulfuromonas sp. TF TaxID=1232410 RepID=UPI00040B3ED5|nr:molybdenum ABC transporter ATP-binding protein [Desulfuromonas sp. TF]